MDLSREAGQITLFKKKKIVTSDETWCFSYDSEVRCHILLWKFSTLPKPKKAHTSKTGVKNILIHLFNTASDFIPKSLFWKDSVSCYLMLCSKLAE